MITGSNCCITENQKWKTKYKNTKRGNYTAEEKVFLQCLTTLVNKNFLLFRVILLSSYDKLL